MLAMIQNRKTCARRMLSKHMRTAAIRYQWPAHRQAPFATVVERSDLALIVHRRRIMMRIFFIPLSLVSLSLCFFMGSVSEAKAQEVTAEVRLRDGKVMRVTRPTMDYDSAYLELGGGRKVERANVSLLCFPDCKDASRPSTERNLEQDLVVLRDGRRSSGEINYIGERGSKDCLLLSYDNIALGEISFVKFSDRSFYSLRHALRAPRRATHLTLRQTSREARLLSARLGHLTNLKTLNISCWDDVRVNLPAGIGHLVKLERLIINSGNGCFLAVTLPTSIGKLKNLKALVMNGTLSGDLPKTLASLPNLEELEMSREGLESVPSLIASLRNLRKLTLDDNDIAETPAFITNLKNLKELSFIGNGGIKLRDSLANMKGLKVHLGNNYLTLRDQELLRRRFPDLVLDFENVMLDGTVNEEPPPKK
jgi:hypothetical protein